MTASGPSGAEITAIGSGSRSSRASCADPIGVLTLPFQQSPLTFRLLLAVVDDKTLDLGAGRRELNCSRQARYRVGVAVHELDRLLVVGV